MITRLCEIPGIALLTAWTIIAEIGFDMSRFATSGLLASWCGLCPGNAESAGKRQSGPTSKGNLYFAGLWWKQLGLPHGLAGARRALAVAHRLLTVVYCLIGNGVRYCEQGADYFDRMHPERVTNRLKAKFEALGFEVDLRPALTPETS